MHKVVKVSALATLAQGVTIRENSTPSFRGMKDQADTPDVVHQVADTVNEVTQEFGKTAEGGIVKGASQVDALIATEGGKFNAQVHSGVNKSIDWVVKIFQDKTNQEDVVSAAHRLNSWLGFEFVPENSVRKVAGNFGKKVEQYGDQAEKTVDGYNLDDAIAKTGFSAEKFGKVLTDSVETAVEAVEQNVDQAASVADDLAEKAEKYVADNAPAA
jgi:ElaB/YqjD/DUF883 family membrane-anchored ribosome-binding protein